jgi:plasmid stabilization system protein ParE
MAYLVELAARAARDLEILYVEKNAAESQAASRWYNGLEEAISTLAQHPYRCPKAPEAKNKKRDLRHLLYGNKPHIYRVIFEIDENGQSVWVLHIRHGARKSLKASDLE